MTAAASRDDVVQTAQDLLRAVGGGLFVGLPLLFTMEMWFHSFLLPSWKIVLLLGVTFLIVLGYTVVSGFRRDRSYTELLVDSIETMGIGAVVATLALVLLGRVDLDVGLRDAVGKIALETIPIAVGVSLAATQLASPDDQDDEQGSAQQRDVGPFGRLVVAAGGALVFALNVAPTEEPVLLGVEAEWWLLLGVMGGTLAMTFAVVFFADFRGGRSARHRGGPLDHPVSETVAAYAVSLVISVLLLWSFGRLEGVGASAAAGQVVMLGIVASFGAAAGRLLVGGDSRNGGR